MEFLVTIANLLFVSSYFVRHMLKLRILSLAGVCCLVAYFASLPEPLMHVVYWNLFYAALNAVWIARLLMERRPGAADGTATSAMPEPPGE
ncbi:MAG: hypothetical protein JJU06_09145 [Ectothiorhodospiraceae bacterium]|nr:hypothetical protein [Ectothiorhodospiraceae bacterium]MCH8504819.1 hypothetical protein [Ectothiorhodospiraceae bacterium]